MDVSTFFCEHFSISRNIVCSHPHRHYSLNIPSEKNHFGFSRLVFQPEFVPSEWMNAGEKIECIESVRCMVARRFVVRLKKFFFPPVFVWLNAAATSDNCRTFTRATRTHLFLIIISCLNVLFCDFVVFVFYFFVWRLSARQYNATEPDECNPPSWR